MNAAAPAAPPGGRLSHSSLGRNSYMTQKQLDPSPNRFPEQKKKEISVSSAD